MQKSLLDNPVLSKQPANMPGKRKTFEEDRRIGATMSDEQQTGGRRAHQSGKLHSSRFGGYMAFVAAACVSIMAAATVASHDLPLMLGGF